MFYLMPSRIFNYSASIQEIQGGLVSCHGSSYVTFITFSYWHHVHNETFILDVQELFYDFNEYGRLVVRQTVRQAAYSTQILP